MTFILLHPRNKPKKATKKQRRPGGRTRKPATRKRR